MRGIVTLKDTEAWPPERWHALTKEHLSSAAKAAEERMVDALRSMDFAESNLKQLELTPAEQIFWTTWRDVHAARAYSEGLAKAQFGASLSRILRMEAEEGAPHVDD